MEPALYRLPNELLHQICSYLTFEPIRNDNTLCYYERDYLAVTKDLRSTALTCSRLTPVAQEHLFRSPFLYDDCVRHTKFLSFLRVVLERPNLAACVTALRLSINGHIHHEYSRDATNQSSLRTIEIRKDII